jgi:hypothetical protein
MHTFSLRQYLGFVPMFRCKGSGPFIKKPVGATAPVARPVSRMSPCPLHRNLGALRGRIAPAEGVAENANRQSRFPVGARGRLPPLKCLYLLTLNLTLTLKTLILTFLQKSLDIHNTIIYTIYVYSLNGIKWPQTRRIEQGGQAKHPPAGSWIWGYDKSESSSVALRAEGEG